MWGIVLKPGPARRVDPGPGRPGPRTGPGLSKNPLGSWPGETRATRVNPTETRPLFFFFNIHGRETTSFWTLINFLLLHFLRNQTEDIKKQRIFNSKKMKRRKNHNFLQVFQQFSPSRAQSKPGSNPSSSPTKHASLIPTKNDQTSFHVQMVL